MVINNSFRSKEDDVMKISTMFVTNFPDESTAKELFHACSVYGYVVDSYIPNKRAKNGKRFGFVRFINVFSEERLANNLCTVWMGRHKQIANISRFQRNNNKGGNKIGVENINNPVRFGVSIGDSVDKSPTMILDDECLVSSEFSNSLFGSQDARQLFRDSVSVGSWFSILKEASSDFHCDKRIAKIRVFTPKDCVSTPRIQEVYQRTLKLYFVVRSIGYVRKKLQEDSCFHSKRLCVHTMNPRSISEDFKIIFHGNVYWIRAKETPGRVPDFADAYGDEDSDDAISNDEGDKNQNSNIFGDDDYAKDGREH
nr:hypothetical protein [Tanacetum cinerariifolium]